MKKKIISLVLMITMVSTVLAGCGKGSFAEQMLGAMAKKQDIALSVSGNMSTNKNDFEWNELGQITVNEKIRKTWNDTFNTLIFDLGSHNGILYVDDKGNWAENNTMYNVFMNKKFREIFDEGTTQTTLAKAAEASYSDITDDASGVIASINGYFDLIQANSDGTSGLTNAISRAQAMTALYKASTPVQFNKEDLKFTKAVGDSKYNTCAQNMDKYSFLQSSNNSLNYTTYNQPITRAELVYMLVKQYYSDEYDNVSLKGVDFSDCKNAGNIAKKYKFTITDKKTGDTKAGYAWQSYELEFALQNAKDGAPEDLYKALVVGYNHGLIGATTRWNEAALGGELIYMLQAVYEDKTSGNNFLTNASSGANVGQSLYVTAKAEPVEPKTSTTIATTEVKGKILAFDDFYTKFKDELDLTKEEYDEFKTNESGFTFDDIDKYMVVDHCYFLNVRKGPGTEFEIYSDVPAGTKVHIVGLCEENGWYRVIYNRQLFYQSGVYFSELPE